MTASTTNTATAPRLPETELQFNEMEDDFQNMFGSLEKRYYTPQDSSQERALQPVCQCLCLYCRLCRRAPSKTP